MSGKQTFEYIRAAFEIAYFGAGIAIALFAYKGLAQIKLTKDIATSNAKREAFKLAVEQCRFFAEQVVPARAKIVETARTKGFVFGRAATFEILEGEITKLETPGRDINAEGAALELELVLYLNRLEAFAMTFISGVADEMVAYRETAAGFCQLVKEAVPFIYAFRQRGIRYESTIRLSEMWNNRLQSEALTKQKAQIEKHLQGIKPATIKPLGIE